MRPIAMLWLALIGALSFAPRTSVREADACAERTTQLAAARSAVGPADIEGSFAAAPAHGDLDLALRAPRVAARRQVGCAQAGGTHDGPRADSPPILRSLAGTTAGDHALRRLGAFDHAVPARGSVAPYYSTAPPLQA